MRTERERAKLGATFRIPPVEEAGNYADRVVRHLIRHQWDPTPEGWGTIPDAPPKRWSPYARALLGELQARSRRLLYKRFTLKRAPPLKERVEDAPTHIPKRL